MKNAFLNEQATKKALSEFILSSDRLSMDGKCLEFEKAFAQFQGTKEAVLFNSGGSANLAMLQALKNLGRLKDGAKVGFTALTWSTNVMPIIQLGMQPVAVDINKETLNTMADNLLDTLAKEDLDAFFLTNVLGFAGDLNKIKALCKRNNILLLEDNCESLGTELASGKTGNFGLASSFSFFVAHHMSTIEGGMVATFDTELAEMLRIVRANGWDRNLTATQQKKWRNKFKINSEFQAKYTFYDLGFNLRPTEITGFLGLFQLQFLEDNIKQRAQHHLLLEKYVKKNPDLILLNRKHVSKFSSFCFPVICKTPQLKEKYLSQCAGAGVEIRPMIAGNIQHQPFYKKYVNDTRKLPNTDFIHENGFYFGNYPELTESDLETLASCLTRY